MIAVVEDDVLVRNGIASLLRASGFNTSTFETGHAFLVREPSTKIDLLISDYRMPGMTGVELIRTLSLAGDPVPVIIITAHFQLGIAEAAIGAGALGFLRKPFDHIALLELVWQSIG